MNHVYTKPRRVDFAKIETDFEVALLGSLGFSTKMIARKTGLSPCQITYRLWKGRIKRADYRNGVSNEAGAILATLKPKVAPMVRGHLRLVTRTSPAPSPPSTPQA